MQPAGDAACCRDQEMESCAAPMALMWEERFHSSAQLGELQ